jgi:hypothetical protein
LLRNLSEAHVCNRNEHLIQFRNLFFRQKFRLDREQRKNLLIGKFPIILDLKQEKDLQRPLEQFGII